MTSLSLVIVMRCALQALKLPMAVVLHIEPSTTRTSGALRFFQRNEPSADCYLDVESMPQPRLGLFTARTVPLGPPPQ